MPYSEQEEPQRAKLLNDIDDPSERKSNTLKDDPNLLAP
jgi:hypothetical protein